MHGIEAAAAKIADSEVAPDRWQHDAVGEPCQPNVERDSDRTPYDQGERNVCSPRASDHANEPTPS